jgi:hypothetical protein
MALHRRLLALEPHAQKAVIAAEILALVAVAGALG